MSTDPMARLRSVDPARRVDLSHLDPGALRAVREGITMTVREPETADGASEARTRRGLGRLGLGRRGTIAVGLSVVLAGGSLGFAAYHQLFRGGLADGINCLSSWEGQSVSTDGPPLTGDPIADCATYMAGSGVAPLVDPVAFTYQGMLYVTPRDQVPEGAELLPVDPQAAHARELEASLHDMVDGGRSACLGGAEAEAVARAELSRLGLDGWTVHVDDTVLEPQNIRPCADLWTDTAAKRVDVLPQRADDPGSNPLLTELVADLRTGIANQCLSLDAARAVADDALVKADALLVAANPGHDVTVAGGAAHWPTTSVLDESASCARVDLEVGGSIQVTVYGPTTAHPAG